MAINLFTFGKYRNQSHDWVLENDPGYIKWAYETVDRRAGISRSTYAAACDALDHGDDDYKEFAEDFGLFHD